MACERADRMTAAASRTQLVELKAVEPDTRSTEIYARSGRRVGTAFAGPRPVEESL